MASSAATLVPSQGDAGDDRNPAVGRLDEAFDDRGLFVLGEEGAFAGMAENDQAFDAVMAAEPGAEALDRGVIDSPSRVKG